MSLPLSFNSTLLSDMPVRDAICVMAEAGYQGIDISAQVALPFLPSPPPHLTPETDLATRRDVRRHAEQAGIKIVAVNAHNSLIHPLSEIRQANIEYAKGALELASDLCADYVVVGGGRKEFYGWNSVYWDRLVQALRELLTVAGPLGVKLAVEASSQPGALLHGASRVQRLLACDGLGALGLLFDSAHFHIRGEDVARAFQVLSHRVIHIHWKDARGHMEDYECPPLGTGEVDFERLLVAMQSSGYSGYIAVEDESCAWGYEMDPRQALADAKHFVQGIFASVEKAGHSNTSETNTHFS